MRREVMLIEQIRKELADNRAKHVQVLLKIVKGRKCIQFLSVDTDACRSKVKAICDRYCESLCFVSESSTTMLYSM